MKVRIPHHQLAIDRALARLSGVDPATGQRRRWQTINALKADCRIEEIVEHCLEQAPANPGSNELRFVCIWHPDTNPSLWVNIEKQRWGCNAGCYSSGDVID